MKLKFDPIGLFWIWLAAVGLSLFLSFSESGVGEWSRLILMELISIGIIVFVVDRLIAAHHRKINAPRANSATLEVLHLLGRFVSLWEQMVRSAKPGGPPIKLKSPEALVTVLLLRLGAKAPVVPDRPWLQYLQQSANELRRAIRDLRASGNWQYVHPDVVAVLNDLDSTTFLNYIESIAAVVEARAQMNIASTTHTLLSSRETSIPT